MAQPVTDLEAPITVITEGPPQIDLRLDDLGPNAGLFDKFEGLTYDDVVLVPSFSHVIAAEVDLSASLLPTFSLAVPLLVAETDVVGAVSAALAGAMGVIGASLSIDAQCRAVDRVKRTTAGWIVDPIVVGPTATVGDAFDLMSSHGISGLPVVDGLGRLIGMVTRRDLRFCTDSDRTSSLRLFMTKMPLVTAPRGSTIDDARRIFVDDVVEKLPMIDEHGWLLGVITARDVIGRDRNPDATRDLHGRLRCAAAVTVGPEMADRAGALVRTDVDTLIVESAAAGVSGIRDAVRDLRRAWPEVPIIAKGAVDAEAVAALHQAGADAVIVRADRQPHGIVDLPALSAIYEVAAAARAVGTPMIADVGAANAGDVTKALATGAGAAMLRVNTPEELANTLTDLRDSMARTGAATLAKLREDVRLLRVTHR